MTSIFETHFPMALFRTRNSSDNKAEPATRNKSASVDTVETLRTRARQRLIGSALLLLAGIITFTLLFDNKPRPIPTDIEIIIPDKDKVVPISAPAQVPVQTPAQAPASAQISTPTAAGVAASNAVTEPAPSASSVKPAPTTATETKTVQASSSLDAKEELVTAKPAVKAEVKTEPKPPVKQEPKIDPKSTSKANTKPNADDGAKAKAILEGKDPKVAAPTLKRIRLLKKLKNLICQLPS
ncbi:MAG: hypothetical protein IPQ12_05610 [Polaromonas sp.]|nr:hypothetical protein [Polaromonas sp.]